MRAILSHLFRHFTFELDPSSQYFSGVNRGTMGPGNVSAPPLIARDSNNMTVEVAQLGVRMRVVPRNL